jgi:hypothetical protein
VRSGNKLIEYEGKGSCDGYGNVPKHTLKHAIESGALINPGTRELVLYMAEHKQAPSIPKARKNGWEAVDRYFWGYIDTARFTKTAVPDADSWKGSKSFHEYSGRCADRQHAESEGPLQACPSPSQVLNPPVTPHSFMCSHALALTGSLAELPLQRVLARALFSV